MLAVVSDDARVTAVTAARRLAFAITPSLTFRHRAAARVCVNFGAVIWHARRHLLLRHHRLFRCLIMCPRWCIVVAAAELDSVQAILQFNFTGSCKTAYAVQTHDTRYNRMPLLFLCTYGCLDNAIDRGIICVQSSGCCTHTTCHTVYARAPSPPLLCIAISVVCCRRYACYWACRYRD